jgi:hypothetical protein
MVNDRKNSTESTARKIFNLNSKDLFFYIQVSMKKYKNSKAKNIEQLFFIIMSLNHIREWIAPGYKHTYKPINVEQEFYNDIYELQEFKTIQDLCNGIKHLGSSKNTEAQYGLKIDDWDAMFDDVKSFDDGPPSKFTVDGMDIENVLDKVIDFYSREWFDKNT